MLAPTLPCHPRALAIGSQPSFFAYLRNGQSGESLAFPLGGRGTALAVVEGIFRTSNARPYVSCHGQIGESLLFKILSVLRKINL